MENVTLLKRFLGLAGGGNELILMRIDSTFAGKG